MSTKATVAFTTHDGQVMAAVYVHNGGDVTPEFLGEFFADVIADNGAWVRGYRFFDPSYLAAKFVAWLSGPTMASQGIGVIARPEAWHAHRRFTIRCHEEPSAEPPEVTEDAKPAAPVPLPDAPNAQLVGGDGHGRVTVSMPRAVMTREEALAHAAWIVGIADPGGEEFPRYLNAVRST